MRFERDEVKNQANLRKHGLDFADAQEMFEGPLLTIPDLREDYGEERWIAIGMIHGILAVAVFAEREQDVLRVISLRRAIRNEHRQYTETVQNQLEARQFHERQRH